MAVTTIPKAGIADDAVDNTKLDLASNYAFTGTVTGAGKLINTSRVLYTSGTITMNTGSTITDTGVDHNYTGSSTSNKLLHIINCAWRKQTEGGHAGGITIYADDSAITAISSGIALGEWHQDSATADMKGSSIHYFSNSIASTSAIKYSIYSKGDDFRLQNNSTLPLIWTILEIS